MNTDENDDSATSFGAAVGEKGAAAFKPETAKTTGDVGGKPGAAAAKPQSTGAQTPMDVLSAYYAKQQTTSQKPAGTGAPDDQGTQSADQHRQAGAAQGALNSGAANITSAGVRKAQDAAGAQERQKGFDAAKPRKQAQFDAAMGVDSTPVQAPATFAKVGEAVQNREHPRHHGNAAGDWRAGPTGYVGFDQYFGDNAATANRSADQLESRVRGDLSGAQGNLDASLGGWKQGLGSEVGRASVSGDWGDYGGFDPSGLEDQFATARDEQGALGKGAGGVQALSGQGGQRPLSRFGAGLTAAAGKPQFDRLANDYAGLDTALSDAATGSQDTLHSAQTLAQQNHDAIEAAKAQGAQAGRGAPHDIIVNGQVVGRSGGATASGDDTGPIEQTDAGGAQGVRDAPGLRDEENVGKTFVPGHEDENGIWVPDRWV